MSRHVSFDRKKYNEVKLSPARSSTMVSDGKVVCNVHAYVYLLMYMRPRSSSSSHTHKITQFISLLRRRLSFFVSLTVTINLSVFLSNVLR
jgi:hypothetical protein